MRVGVIGGGQLGRMLGLAGIPLGCTFTFLDPSADACAGVAGDVIVAAYDDPDALTALAECSDVVTYEFENVPAAAVDRVAERVPVHPARAALSQAQDRLREKRLFDACGLPVPPFVDVDEPTDRALREAADRVGYPVVVKTRREGYDGKGQSVMRSPGDASAAADVAGGRPVLVEAMVDFDRELSIVAARGWDGSTAFYPVVENHHRDGILRLSRAPAPDVPPGFQQVAERYATAAMSALDYVGVLAIELFAVRDDLLGNEMAPRVHNSGHWTIEGAETSQFENHLRAVLGLPLGPTEPRGHCAMVNLIGELPELAQVAALPGAHIHLYGKQPRPGRKLGHVTLRSDDPEELERLLSVLYDR